MAGRDVAAVCPVGSLAQRSVWYRALAQTLASGRPPCGAVFEASSATPIGVVIVRPAGLLATLRTSAAATATQPVPVPPPLDPPRVGPGLLGVLRAIPRSEDSAADGGGVPPELPALAPFVKEGGWVGVQTLWLPRLGGRICVATRCRVVAPDRAMRGQLADAVAARLLLDWAHATGTAARVAWTRTWGLDSWRRGRITSIPADAWFVGGSELHRTAELGLAEFRPRVPSGGAHTVVFGASGAGKSTFLAAEAARAITAGQPVFVLDLHGDLAPRVLGRLSPAERARVLAVDAGESPVPGISGLVAGSASIDRAAAHFVAAVKRLSPDGVELAWGFRLERIFDTFARLVLETGGSLVDLYALLTDPDRRESARLATRRPTTARFLDELGPILRRDPEFLWSAATRLSKIVLVPALVELLAPADGGLDVEALLGAHRSILVRLPLATLGPESAAFAATLVLGRIYLGVAARREDGRPREPVLFVLDEVQSLSPRLIAEMLAEGRKFGVEVLVATQYPERLTPEVRSAAAGAAASFVSFRIPPASVTNVAPWLGLPASQAARVLPGLPVGVGARSVPEQTGIGWVRPVAGRTEGIDESWTAALGATRMEFGTEREASPTWEEAATERVLLAVLAAEERGRRLGRSEIVLAATELPGEPVASERLELARTALVRGPELEETPTGVRLSPSGERRLGLGRATGATRETAEHRRLLVRTFRIFARHGYLLEILRQGRFDTTLPDARFRQLGRDTAAESPADLAHRIDRFRAGWAWKFFGGRDVHVEAEVSGALRPERIRHGCTKATGRGAFVLFVVGDAGRARRVRGTLRTLGLGPGHAQVWTLTDGSEVPGPNP